MRPIRDSAASRSSLGRPVSVHEPRARRRASMGQRPIVASQLSNRSLRDKSSVSSKHPVRDPASRRSFVARPLSVHAPRSRRRASMSQRPLVAVQSSLDRSLRDESFVSSKPPVRDPAALRSSLSCTMSVHDPRARRCASIGQRPVLASQSSDRQLRDDSSVSSKRPARRSAITMISIERHPPIQFRRYPQGYNVRSYLDI
jgi:hypothetical protein